MHDAPAIFVALEQSGFAAAIRQSRWLYPFANVGHIVSLVVFAGAVAVMDLRLLGAFAATAPGRVLACARIAAIAAFCGQALTGFGCRLCSRTNRYQFSADPGLSWAPHRFLDSTP